MALYFNCGYARVAIYNLAKKVSKTPNWMKLPRCNQENLVAQFHKRFHNRTAISITNFGNFVRNAKKVLPMFHKKWNPTASRNEYHARFLRRVGRNVQMRQKHCIPYKHAKVA